MADYETVTYEVQAAVAILSMNRPQSRNSLNIKMCTELLAAVRRAVGEDGVRVVILRGEGAGFCAGADLTAVGEGQDEDGYITRQLREKFNPLIAAILQAGKPFIAAVNGAAAGVGAALAMACDLLVMEEQAYLYSAFGAIGLIPDGGSHYFYRNFLGPKKAFELIAFSQRIEALQALELGIANRLASAGSLLPETLAWAGQLSNQAPITLQLTKQLLREAQTADVQEIMDREALLQNTAFSSDDAKEGIAAFLEKRKPCFKGK